MTLSTSRQSGFPEIHVDIADQFASAANWLVNYFETQVQKGISFEPGQTVEVGWSLLQLRQSGDHLEVWEPDFDAMPIRWGNGANNTLRHLTLQRSVCDIVKCEPVFPSIRHAGIVSPRFLSSSSFSMSRDQPSNSDSGWVFAESGYSGTEGEFISLYQIVLERFHVVPFLALPHGAFVRIEAGWIEVSFANETVSSEENALLRELTRSHQVLDI